MQPRVPSTVPSPWVPSFPGAYHNKYARPRYLPKEVGPLGRPASCFSNLRRCGLGSSPISSNTQDQSTSHMQTPTQAGGTNFNTGSGSGRPRHNAQTRRSTPGPGHLPSRLYMESLGGYCSGRRGRDQTRPCCRSSCLWSQDTPPNPLPRPTSTPLPDTHGHGLRSVVSLPMHSQGYRRPRRLLLPLTRPSSLPH